MTLQHWVVAAFLAVGLIFATRVAFMILRRRCVLGTVVGHDYSRELRNRDEDFYLLDRYRHRQRNPYRLPPRSVTLRAEYSFNGKDYRNDVASWVNRGHEPGKLISLWIDPQNPNDVTANGPGYWLVLAIAMAFAALVWRPAGNAFLDRVFPTCVANGVGCKKAHLRLKTRADEYRKD